MDTTLVNALIAAMVFLTVLLVLLAVQGGQTRQDKPLELRLSRLGLRDGPAKADGSDEEARSREALQKALRELEALQKSEGRSYVRQLLKSSGTGRSLRAHLGISVLVGVFVFSLGFIFGLPALTGGLLAVALGAWLPILQLKMAINHRLGLFAEDLPGALDLVVRGIRAGLPLLECLKLTASEWRDPLKSEFTQIINDMGVGLSIKEAVARFAERVPLQEAKLFAIVIAIQAQSGGNLSEVLSNLAELLRERSKLHAKIKAMTSEARTSAWIIGSIPILLVVAVSAMSPGFISPLFETPTGNIVLGGSLAWMMMGILVMNSMMKVDL